jgi:hypothetical protein
LIRESERKYEIEKKASELKEKFVKWTYEDDSCLGKRLVKMDFSRVISKLVWHSKGDYLATMANNIQTSSQVLIHSISKASSTRPFT